MSRRELIEMLGAAALVPLTSRAASVRVGGPAGPGFRIRTITAGTNVKGAADLRGVEHALAFLKKAKRLVTDAGYEVQTIRIATQPFLEEAGHRTRANALPDLQALDRAVVDGGALLSLGPVLAPDGDDPEFGPWAAELARTTRNISFSVRVVSPDRGASPQGVTAAGEAMAAIARATPGGIGNFRFAAAANVPAGTPFFPVAYHHGSDAAAVGVESPPLLTAAFNGAKTLTDAKQRLKTSLESRLGPVEQLVKEAARRDERGYTGIDVSPAPGKDASIGEAIEALTGVPFGAASTLAGCAAITDVLKSVRLKLCGYSGLMLPILEDPVLARRATEGRFTVRDLLLYSSVCGTGLDVVPLPGDTPADQLAALIADVAALSTKLRKPLSARLFPVPGRKVGEIARFNDPYLTDSIVLKAE
ncbi:MAG: DUF711 domain-containing protein [Gemmatimonadetes bacterium]|nr:MAG: DUF711 domain-containing protein [Gemmatimonadota bacterium]PYP95908.1 MAG: DUF711 domain-containing protein [Gemmatimonadota bacterium]